MWKFLWSDLAQLYFYFCAVDRFALQYEGLYELHYAFCKQTTDLIWGSHSIFVTSYLLWLHSIWIFCLCLLISYIKLFWFFLFAQVSHCIWLNNVFVCFVWERLWGVRFVINVWLLVCFLWGCVELDRGKTSHFASSSIVLQMVPVRRAKRLPEETFFTLFIFSILFLFTH